MTAVCYLSEYFVWKGIKNAPSEFKVFAKMMRKSLILLVLI